VPIVDWVIRRRKDGDSAQTIPHLNEWYLYKLRYAGLDPPLPPLGWKRWPIPLGPHQPVFDLESGKILGRKKEPRTNQGLYMLHSRDKSPPQYYYTHEAVEGAKFCYPLPLPENGETSQSHPVVNEALGRYLCGSTHRCFLTLRPSSDRFDEADDVLEPVTGEKIGRFWPDEDPESEKVATVEFVAISMLFHGDAQDRFSKPLNEVVPQHYNVLCVEWTDGVAYRKGFGNIDRSAWERSSPEPVQLILG
jgi:hypothetical protein